MKHSPKLLRRMLNLYGPFLGAGISVDSISSDWKKICVSMRLRWYNRNIMGTHFGGSLYSMVDPHLVLMLMHQLGEDYIVWDKSAEVEFIRPGTGNVTAIIEIGDEELNQIREQTLVHRKYLPQFSITVVDENNKEIARIKKTLYVRKKRLSGEPPTKR